MSTKSAGIGERRGFFGVDAHPGEVATDEDRRQLTESLIESERRYRALFQNLLDGYAYCRLILDDDGKAQDFVYIDVNAAFSKLTGLEDVVGRRVTEVIPGIREDSPELFERYARVVATGLPERFELFLEGLGMWFSVSAFTPSPDHFVAVFENITARRAESDRLAAAEARYQALVANANIAIVVASEDNVIIEANRHALVLFGDSLVGRNAFDIVDPHDQSLFLEKGEELARTGSAFLPDLLVRRSDGAVRSVEASVSSIPIGGKRLSFVVYRDITEEKKLRAQVMVSDRMASVGTLAAGVAHEINNPLAVVVSNVNFLISGEKNSAMSVEMAEALRDTKSAAERVRDIVRDMKLFSRAEDATCGPVDVEAILDSTARMAGNEIKHRAKLVKSYGRVPLVDANESRLGQVFLNLMVNAAQAIDEGHADTNAITLSTRQDDKGRVVVEIRDTGVGMAKATLDKLFTPFFTTKSRGVGTGLGLAICLRIVGGLDGEITVESEPGKGTTFRVILPVSREDRVAEKKARRVTPATRRGRILVIDDERMVGTAVRRILAAEHDVEALTNAQTALDRLRAGATYDVILCDLMMPVMTGVEFHAELGRIAPRQVDHLLFITGGAFTSAARSFLDTNAHVCIEKPFDPDTLRDLVNRRLIGDDQERTP